MCHSVCESGVCGCICTHAFVTVFVNPMDVSVGVCVCHCVCESHGRVSTVPAKVMSTSQFSVGTVFIQDFWDIMCLPACNSRFPNNLSGGGRERERERDRDRRQRLSLCHSDME